MVKGKLDMYKAGDIVVNRRGEVVTLFQSKNDQEFVLYYFIGENAYCVRRDGSWCIDREKKEKYDIVGYAKMTPKGELDQAYGALKHKFEEVSNDIKTPSHYHRLSPEPIVVLEQWNLGNCLSNAIKYICRAGHKEDEVKDLRKAIEYLERKIGMIENDSV
jgi:hypothetical protein